MTLVGWWSCLQNNCLLSDILWRDAVIRGGKKPPHCCTYFPDSLFCPLLPLSNWENHTSKGKKVSYNDIYFRKANLWKIFEAIMLDPEIPVCRNQFLARLGQWYSPICHRLDSCWLEGWTETQIQRRTGNSESLCSTCCLKKLHFFWVCAVTSTCRKKDVFGLKGVMCKL